jgi:hypothetical protein
MHPAPLVSVVTCVFNGERFLREAVESILGQTFKDLEFIIIDDGSTDGTARILAEYERKDPRVRVYHHENRGIAKSANRGCGLARGKYIARMDADDVAMPDRFERQVDFLSKNPEAGLVGGAVEMIDGAGKRLFFDQPPLEDEAIRAALLSFGFPIYQPTVMMRKAAFEAAGGYRAPFVPADDYDLWLRIAQRWRVANLPEVLLRRRLHSQQISIRALRQEVFGALAAHALAFGKGRHLVGPGGEVPPISEEFLEELGVSKAAQQEALAGGYGQWIWCAARASQDETALELVEQLAELSRSAPVESVHVSNALLVAAGIHWRRRRPARALYCLGRAVLARPRLAGRPFRQALLFLFHKSWPAHSES